MTEERKALCSGCWRHFSAAGLSSKPGSKSRFCGACRAGMDGAKAKLRELRRAKSNPARK